MYLTYYVHLVGKREMVECKNARRGNLQKYLRNLLVILL